MALSQKFLQNLPNTPVGKGLNVIRLFDGYTLPPYKILLFLTYRCNLRCTFCLQKDKRSELVQKNPELSLEQWQNALQRLKESFPIKPSIHLFGGEPMKYPEFEGFLKIISENEIKYSITTNGFYLKDSAELLIETKVTDINVSIDSIGEDHDRIRGVKNTYRNAIEGIKKIQKIKHSKGIGRPIVTVNTVINKSNYKNLFEIVKELQKSGPDYISLQHLIFSELGDTEEMDKKTLIDQLRKIKGNALSTPLILIPNIKMGDIRGYYSDLSYPFGNKCLRPWFVPTIFPNGNVMACSVSEVMGNLKEESLKEIWNNEKFRSFRKDIQKNGIQYQYCFRCCHRQYY